MALEPTIAPERFDAAAYQVASRLRENGFIAYFAGGCVRDALMGRPAKDVDIATNAPPEAVAALFPGTHYVGRAFGVSIVQQDGKPFEVAMFRRDIGSADGRRPLAVEPAAPEDDAQRRDFTVNGLFYDPASGRVIDYVGGVEDIRRKIIRAIGDPRLRFKEDHLRLLRAIRFAVVLEFEIDPETREALCADAAAIRQISAERIYQELVRMWTEAPPSGRRRSLYLMRETGLLKHILPEIDAMWGVPQQPDYHPEGDVFTHTALALEKMEGPTPELAWAVLLHDVGKPDTFARDEDGRIHFHNHACVGASKADEILRRLRASNALREAVVYAVENHMRFADWPKMRPAKRRRLLADPRFPLELALHKADCLASHGDLTVYEAAESEYRRYLSEPRLPPPLVRGRDIMALGVPEGPAVGEYLKHAFDLQLEHPEWDRQTLLSAVAAKIKADASRSPA